MASETVLEIPMIARGEIVGLFQLFADGEDAEARLEGVTGLGSALADGMSLALANMALREKLRNQALRDPLTGLYNRRYMEDCAAALRAARRAREPRGLAWSWSTSTTSSGSTTSTATPSATRCCATPRWRSSAALRETDVVCRYGGEELVVILPDCTSSARRDKAEVLRLRIEALSETHGARDLAPRSASPRCRIPRRSVADLLAAADAALYKAKQDGRNQVVTAPLRPFRLDRGPDAPRLVDERAARSSGVAPA